MQRVRGLVGQDVASRRAPKPALRVVALVVSLIATTVVAAAPAAVAQRGPTCFGQPATIVATPGRVTVGTSGPDVIIGTAGRDVIRSGGGDDLVCSRGGNDRVDGGAGDDRIDLGPGDDLASGRLGDDRLLGGAGSDRLRGGPGADRLDGGADADRLFGGPGKDVLEGGSGPDRLVGGPGVDRLVGGPGLDRLVGGAGDDDCGAAGPDIRSRCAARAPTAPEPVADAPASEPEPGLAALLATIEDDVLGVYGAANPWLVEAWNWIDTEGDVVVEDPGPFVAGRVRTLCGGNAGLPLCRATTMTIHPDFVDDVDVIIHELAHVWERTHALAPDRGATARAQLYMLDNHRHQCHPAEVVADTMLHMVRPDAYLAYFDFACPTLPDEPTAEMEAVVAAMLDGVDHPWFASTYGNGTAAWASLMAMTEDPFGFERHVLVHNLADEFGGYCSEANTIDAAFRGGSDPNPWADDGC